MIRFLKRIIRYFSKKKQDYEICLPKETIEKIFYENEQ